MSIGLTTDQLQAILAEVERRNTHVLDKAHNEVEKDRAAVIDYLIIGLEDGFPVVQFMCSGPYDPQVSNVALLGSMTFDV